MRLSHDEGSCACGRMTHSEERHKSTGTLRVGCSSKAGPTLFPVWSSHRFLFTGTLISHS